jgi:hypothetical protein
LKDSDGGGAGKMRHSANLWGKHVRISHTCLRKRLSGCGRDGSQVVEEWIAAGPDAVLNTDQFQDFVYLKLSSYVIAHSNAAYQSYFGSADKLNGSMVRAF